MTDSDSPTEDDAVIVDKNNNVVYRNLDVDDNSDQESLDLNRLKMLPKARQKITTDSDSNVSDIFTTKDRSELHFDKVDSTQDCEMCFNPPNLSNRDGKERSSTVYQGPKKKLLDGTVRLYVGPAGFMGHVNSRMEMLKKKAKESEEMNFSAEDHRSAHHSERISIE